MVEQIVGGIFNFPHTHSIIIGGVAKKDVGIVKKKKKKRCLINFFHNIFLCSIILSVFFQGGDIFNSVVDVSVVGDPQGD